MSLLAPDNNVSPGTVQSTQVADDSGVGVVSRPKWNVGAIAKPSLLYLWRGRGLFGGLLAIGLAYLGQQALLTQNDYQTSTRNYILAIIILIISLTNPSWEILKARSRLQAATPFTDSQAAEATAPVSPQSAATPRWQLILAAPAMLWARWIALRTRLWWRITAIGLAVVGGLTLWSALVLLNNTASPMGGWLWATALAALLLTSLGAPRWPSGDGLLTSPTGDFFGRGVPKLTARWEAILAGSMMLLALSLRLYNLESHPGIFGDEGERGLEGRALVEGRPDNIFGAGLWNVPNLYYYTVAFSFRIFGDNLIADRLVSVLFQTLAVWFVYKLVRLLWGPRAGLIAGTMLAISPLALEFSRLAGESSVTGALWAIGAYFLYMGLRYRRWSDWVLAGSFWSFNLYFYASGKLIIPLAAAVVVYCLIRWRTEFFKKYLLGFALMGFAALLTFMPYGIFSAKDNWQAFMGRANETSIFAPQNQELTFARYGLSYDRAWADLSTVDNLRANPGPWAQLIYQQTRETMDALYRRGDTLFYYRLGDMNRPVFSPLWAVLALLGLAYALWKAWDARFGLALLWFGFGIAGAILTVDTPNLQRFTGAWPAAMIFPAVLVDRVVAAGWPVSRSFGRKWATAPVAVLLVFLTVISYHEYFNEYRATCPFCRDTVQARFVQSLGQEYKGYQLGVGNGYEVYFGYGSTRFVAKGIEGRDVFALADDLPLIDSDDKGAAFIVYGNNNAYLPMLRLIYPGGIEKEEKAQDGVTYLTSYKVSREQVAQLHSVRASYSALDIHNPLTVSRVESRLGNVDTLISGKGDSLLPAILDSAPKVGQWKGGLIAPAYGAYTLALSGTAHDVSLVLDGRTLLTVPTLDQNTPSEQRQVDMVLAKGLHEIKLEGLMRAMGSKFQLLWGSKGERLVPIEPRYLYNGPSGGLLGEIGPSTSPDALKSGEPFADTTLTQRRVDAFVGFREASVLFGQDPYIARWQGSLNISVAGVYAFEVASIGPAVLLIDGQSAFGDGPGGPGPAAVHLAVGQHHVDLRYSGAGTHSRVEWLWMPPGGHQELVPPSALTPLARSWPHSELPNAPIAQLPPPSNNVPK